VLSVQLSLLYANQTEEDILCRSEIEALAKESGGRFKFHYTVDKKPKGNWAYSVGFISEEMIAENLFAKEPGSNNDVQTFMCGPPPMIKFACLPNLEKLGFGEKETENPIVDRCHGHVEVNDIVAGARAAKRVASRLAPRRMIGALRHW